MNTKISLACVVSALLLSPTVQAAPAAGGGGGGGGGAAGARAVAPTAPANRILLESPGNNITTPQQGQTGQSGIQDPSMTANQTSSTANQTGSTNSMSPGTNQMAGATNQMQGDNSSATANANLNGQGVTPNDRLLLTSLSQSVGAQLGVTSPNAMPVRFLIANGAVTLVGVVPTADASQRILARVQQTPGVSSVFNDLRVGTATGTTSQTANPQNGLFSAPTDHAFSPADQTLLSAVQRSAGTQLGITGASTGQMPVHFSIQNGVVGVTGQVSTLQEKQVILAAIQKVQGVNRVVDNVSVVNVTAGGANGSVNPFLNNNNTLTPTSRDQGQSTGNLLNTTNNSGF